MKNIICTVCVALSIIISGCDKQSEPVPQDQWKLEAKKYSRVKKFAFQPGQLALSTNQKNHLRNLVTHPQITGPMYAELTLHSSNEGQNNQPFLIALKNQLMQLGIVSYRIDLNNSPMLARESPMIIVEMNQYSIIEPNCPGWTERMGYVNAPEGERNFGCINARNFARMVEPRDVYLAQQLSGGDGTRNALFIDRYRKDKIKDLKIEQASDNSSAPTASSSTSSTVTSGGSGGN